MKRSSPYHPHSSLGFTLVEIMIVIAIIALLVAMAVPGLLRARKRAQGVSIRTDLRMIDEAMDQYGIEYNKASLAPVPIAAWLTYIKPGSRLYTTQSDLFGQPYGNQVLGVLPVVNSTSWDALSDVCDSFFWSPYTRSP